MAAPSKLFTVILDSQVDPDSPVTTGLMFELRDNDIHLEEWLGDSFVAAKDHDHDDVNSKLIAGGFLFGDEVSDNTTRNTASTTFNALPGSSITIPASEFVTDHLIIVTFGISFKTNSGANPAEVALFIDGVNLSTLSTASIVFVVDADEQEQLILANASPIMGLFFRTTSPGFVASVDVSRVSVKIAK